MKQKPVIPNGWRELAKHEVIGTDDRIWQFDTGPWAYVGGSLVGTRYQRPNVEVDSHWTIIRELAEGDKVRSPKAVQLGVKANKHKTLKKRLSISGLSKTSPE